MGDSTNSTNSSDQGGESFGLFSDTPLARDIVNALERHGYHLPAVRDRRLMALIAFEVALARLVDAYQGDAPEQIETSIGRMPKDTARILDLTNHLQTDMTKILHASGDLSDDRQAIDAVNWVQGRLQGNLP